MRLQFQKTQLELGGHDSLSYQTGDFATGHMFSGDQPKHLCMVTNSKGNKKKRYVPMFKYSSSPRLHFKLPNGDIMSHKTCESHPVNVQGVDLRMHMSVGVITVIIPQIHPL